MSTIETSSGQENAQQALPTAETVAGGLLAGGRNAAWLKKDECYRLFLEIEALINCGNKADSVLAMIGISRQIYYGRIWFSPNEAAAYALKIEQQTATEAMDPSRQDANGTERKSPPTAQQKLDRIAEVSRLRYVEGHNFDEACRLAGIRQDRFYSWSGQRDKLMQIVKRQKARQLGKNGIEGRMNRSGRERETIDDATLEKRRQMISVIHRKVREGTSLLTVLRKKGIRSSEYHEWARQTETPILKRERPHDLWREYRAAEQKEELLERFIIHFRPAAERIAHHYADIVRQSGTFHVDEEMLVSVGLFEGVVKNMDVFDEGRGVPISTFFQQKIAQRMLDELRIQDWVPRLERKQEKSKKNLANEFYRVMNRYAYNDAELAEYAEHVSVPAPMSTPVPYLKSFDAILGKSASGLQNHDGEDMTLYEITESNESSQDDEFQLQSTLTEGILQKCNAQEKAVLQGYYLQGMSMKEVGQKMDLSESRVSQLHSRIIERLQQLLELDQSMPIVHRNQTKTDAIAS